MLMLINLVFSASVDFDPVNVQAIADRPPALLTDTTRSVCPGMNNLKAWSECAANLSYAQIVEVCNSLGINTKKVVAELFQLPSDDVYTSHVDMRWHGCLFNTVSGARTEEYEWIWDGHSWIMRDLPSVAVTAKQAGSFSAFDGLEVGHSSNGRSFDIKSSFAYQLTPMSTSGMWVARTAWNNQELINDFFRQNNINPPYCDAYELALPNHSCTPLLPLLIKEVSPTMIAVSSLATDHTPYGVYGIFFRSLTGYNFTESQ